MSITASTGYTPVALPGSLELPRKRWTRSDYHQFVSLGMIEEGAPFELIKGEVIQKAEQNRRRVISRMLALRLMIRAFPEENLQSRAPVALGRYNSPEPDVAVLRGPLSDYMEEEPGPDDILLLVEVSNTTLQFDRSVKAAIYARTGVPEYWVLDVNERTLDVHRQPTPTGYASITQLTDADRVSPLAAPNASLLVADFLPPAS
jgi:Uma2 family endonuclease